MGRGLRGIRLNPQAVRLDRLGQLAGDRGVVKAGDRQLFALAYIVAEIKSLANILAGRGDVSDVGVRRAEREVSEGEVGIDLHRALEQRNGLQVALCVNDLAARMNAFSASSDDVVT